MMEIFEPSGHRESDPLWTPARRRPPQTRIPIWTATTSRHGWRNSNVQVMRKLLADRDRLAGLVGAR